MRRFDVSALTYPHNLLYLVFNGENETELPVDIVNTMDFVLATLTEREQTFIRLRFVECKSPLEIAPLIGVSTRPSVDNLQNKILLKLRHKSRFPYIKNGLAKQQQNIAEQQQNITERRRIAAERKETIAELERLVAEQRMLEQHNNAK